MTNLAELLAQVRTRGIRLTVEGDKLRYQGPKGVLTDELRQRLTINKAEIIRLLQAETTPPHREGPPYPDGLGRVKCCYCRHCIITGTKATCQVSGESRTGIALLIKCSDFAMTTVH